MFLTVGFFVENQTNTTNQLHCLSALSMPATSVMRCCAYPVRWVRSDPLWWQAINLRIFAHTHTKVKQTENNGGRWMILMMSCVVLWHQIGHDLTCHARSTQYNWATSCIQLPNFWENIVSCLSISLRAVRECLFAQVPVLICESHLDASQLHSRDTLPVAPDRWRIKWNLFAWGNVVLWSFWISVCNMDHIFKLSRPTRSPSFKGCRRTGCHCCRM